MVKPMAKITTYLFQNPRKVRLVLARPSLIDGNSSVMDSTLQRVFLLHLWASSDSLRSFYRLVEDLLETCR